MSHKHKLSRSCKFKIRYENEQAALIALRVLDANKRYVGKPYECSVCGLWHVGERSWGWSGCGGMGEPLPRQTSTTTSGSDLRPFFDPAPGGCSICGNAISFATELKLCGQSKHATRHRGFHSSVYVFCQSLTRPQGCAFCRPCLDGNSVFGSFVHGL